MSEKSTTVSNSGVGFYLDANKINANKIKNFVINHYDTFKTISERWEILEFESFVNTNKIEAYSCYASSLITPYAFISNIMSAETELTFWATFSNKDIGDSCIIYPPTYPWRLSEKAKNLTYPELVKIMSDYLNELCENESHKYDISEIEVEFTL